MAPWFAYIAPLNQADFERRVSIEVIAKIVDYLFAADHGFIPFQCSQTEACGFAKTGASASRSIRLAISLTPKDSCGAGDSLSERTQGSRPGNRRSEVPGANVTTHCAPP